MSSPTAAAGTVTIFPQQPVTFRAAYVHFLIHIFADLTGASIALSRHDRLGRISDAIRQWGVITDRISRTIISVTRGGRLASLGAQVLRYLMLVM